MDEVNGYMIFKVVVNFYGINKVCMYDIYGNNSI